MIKSNRRFFEIWGDAEAQNCLLKGLLMFFTLLLALATVSLTILALRKSPLYVISEHLTSEVQAQVESTATLDIETRHAISRFVGLRMNWEAPTINIWKTQILELIAKEVRPKFVQSQTQMLQAIKTKQMNQKFYLTSLKLIADQKLAVIEGSRLIEVDGVKAVLPATLKLQFAFGDRTSANPEGIYIVSEDFQGADDSAPIKR